MKKFLLFLFAAFLTMPALKANEVYFYFQDGEEDDFELMAPQSLVSIWNETDEEPVAVPEDMLFMAYQFDGAKLLRISPSDFDYELVVEVDGNDDVYFLDKEETEWYLTLLPDADNLEIYVRVYLAGQAPGGNEASNVTMNFNVQAADGSDIANPGENISISYFDIDLFQVVELTIEDNYVGASVKPGTSFEIVPAEGYVVTEVITYLPGVASISEPGEDDDIWRISVSWEPENDFAAFFITVDKAASDGPVIDPDMATITQIENLQWMVTWKEYVFISQTDTDYDNNNAYLTAADGTRIVLNANLHGAANPAIIFPDASNFFTVNLEKLNLANGIYTLTIPEGYVQLGPSRDPSPAQTFDIEIGKSVDVAYTIQFSELMGNTFDITWENVTALAPGNTTGAYMRNVKTNEVYQLEYLKDELYSKANLRIFNDYMLRVNIENNYPDLPSGMYEFYLPAGYVKFNGTNKTNDAYEGYLFTYQRPWKEGEVEFVNLSQENKLIVKWVEASEIAYDTEYAGDGNKIEGVTIFDVNSQQYNIKATEWTISENTLTVDISGLDLPAGECYLLVPEDMFLVTVDGETDYNTSQTFIFVYGDDDNPGLPELFGGEPTWSVQTGDKVEKGTLIEVSWSDYTLTFVEDPEDCSVHNFETGLIDLQYGTQVTLSDDKTKILIDLSNLRDYTYRVNVPEACVYLDVNGTTYLNTGTSMDGVIVDNTGSVDSVIADNDGHFRVVNLSGVVVLDTDNADDLKSLPRGFYIVNGQKIVK